MSISRSSMLRLIRGLPDPLVSTVAVLGVDDFAFRRRHDYGTILVNMADGHPVDLLADRWHLWHNLGQAVDKTVAAHRECLRDPVEDAPAPTLPL